MTVRRIAAVAALLAAVGLAPAAAAAETYLTAGLAAGRFTPDLPAGCVANQDAVEGAGAAFGVGYGFDERFAVEFGWHTLGSLDVDAVCPGPVAATFDAPDSGLSVSGLGRIGLGDRYALTARLGAYSWSAAADSGTEAIVGLGVEREWRRGVSARLEYAAYGSELAALHLTFRFGF